ncbi:MAG: hypothetical protein ACPGVT_01235 [Maricaulaceae bacterium]
MENNRSNRFAGFVTLFLGLLLIGLGLTTLVHPQIMERYGLNADSLHAIMSIRALIGGAEIGLGLLMMAGGKLGISIRSRLWTGLFLFSGIVAARLISLFLADAAIPELIYREFIAEVIIVGVICTGLKK